MTYIATIRSITPNPQLKTEAHIISVTIEVKAKSTQVSFGVFLLRCLDRKV